MSPTPEELDSMRVEAQYNEKRATVYMADCIRYAADTVAAAIRSSELTEKISIEMCGWVNADSGMPCVLPVAHGGDHRSGVAGE